MTGNAHWTAGRFSSTKKIVGGGRLSAGIARDPPNEVNAKGRLSAGIVRGLPNEVNVRGRLSAGIARGPPNEVNARGRPSEVNARGPPNEVIVRRHPNEVNASVRPNGDVLRSGEGLLSVTVVRDAAVPHETMNGTHRLLGMNPTAIAGTVIRATATHHPAASATTEAAVAATKGDAVVMIEGHRNVGVAAAAKTARVMRGPHRARALWTFCRKCSQGGLLPAASQCCRVPLLRNSPRC